VAYTAAPLQNREHGAGAFDLGDNAVVCVVGPSFAVVAAGHDCGRDGLIPFGRRACRLGWEVVGDHPKPTWRTPMRRDTATAGGDVSGTVSTAGRTSDRARCAISSTGVLWRQGNAGFAMPGIDEWSVIDTKIGARGQQR
jgi:hypothetical protein